MSGVVAQSVSSKANLDESLILVLIPMRSISHSLQLYTQNVIIVVSTTI